MNYNIISSYTTCKNISSGVLQNNYFSIPKFATFKGSSSVSNSETVVFNNKVYYKSENKPNSNFTIKFNKHAFKLSGLSLLSCYASQCVYSFDVFGSNNGEDWINECSVEKEKNYFMGEIRYADCESKNMYKYYRIMHKAGTTDSSLEIYYLDLFGDLLVRVYCHNTRKYIVFHNFIFAALLFLEPSH